MVYKHRFNITPLLIGCRACSISRWRTREFQATNQKRRRKFSASLRPIFKCSLEDSPVWVGKSQLEKLKTQQFKISLQFHLQNWMKRPAVWQKVKGCNFSFVLKLFLNSIGDSPYAGLRGKFPIRICKLRFFKVALWRTCYDTISWILLWIWYIWLSRLGSLVPKNQKPPDRSNCYVRRRRTRVNLTVFCINRGKSRDFEFWNSILKSAPFWIN